MLRWYWVAFGVKPIKSSISLMDKTLLGLPGTLRNVTPPKRDPVTES